MYALERVNGKNDTNANLTLKVCAVEINNEIRGNNATHSKI